MYNIDWMTILYVRSYSNKMHTASKGKKNSVFY